MSEPSSCSAQTDGKVKLDLSSPEFRKILYKAMKKRRKAWKPKVALPPSHVLEEQVRRIDLLTGFNDDKFSTTAPSTTTTTAIPASTSTIPTIVPATTATELHGN